LFAGTVAASAVIAGEIAANKISAGTFDADIIYAGTLAWTNVMGTGKPSNNADVTLTAINGGLSLTGGGLTLTSGGAQIVTGNYAAPNGSSEGAGFKVNDGGNIEAYGTSQALMGRIVSRNADYMACIGCYASTSYLTTHYAPINSTYFPTDGRVHLYSWSGSSWLDMYGDESQFESSSSATTIDFWTESIATGSSFMYEVSVIAVISGGAYDGCGIWTKVFIGCTNIGGTLYHTESPYGNIITWSSPATGLSHPFIAVSGTTMYVQVYNNSSHTIKWQTNVIKRKIAL